MRNTILTIAAALLLLASRVGAGEQVNWSNMETAALFHLGDFPEIAGTVAACRNNPNEFIEELRRFSASLAIIAHPSRLSAISGLRYTFQRRIEEMSLQRYNKIANRPTRSCNDASYIRSLENRIDTILTTHSDVRVR